MESPSKIRAICQAGKDRDPGWYIIHRRVSIYLTWLLLHTRLTPNQVSVLMMLAGCTGAALLSSVRLGVNLFGFFFLYLAFLLDKADGEIARYRCMESVRGMLLDRLHHRLVEPSIFLAVAYREYQLTSSPNALIAGLLTILLANTIDEHQHLSARIFVKHLNQGGKLPTPRKQKASPGLRQAITLLKPLKGFRVLIVVLPLLALVYGLEWLSGWPVTKFYLYTSVAGLSVYLAFQSYYSFAFKLEGEIASLLETFRDGTGSSRIEKGHENSDDGRQEIVGGEILSVVEVYGRSASDG